jgi:hypothetical protein
MDFAAKVQAERVRLLREAGHTVCDYTFDDPERDADPVYAGTLARDVMKARQAIGDTRSDAEAVSILSSSSETFAVFSRTHPKTFEMMCSLEHGPRHLRFMADLVAVRKKVKSGEASEQGANAHVSSMVLAAT